MSMNALHKEESMAITAMAKQSVKTQWDLTFASVPVEEFQRIPTTVPSLAMILPIRLRLERGTGL